MTGATQYHVRCPHLSDRPAETSMASQISASNKRRHLKEDRVAPDVSHADLEAWLDQCEEQDAGAVVVCNVQRCRRVLLVGGGVDQVLHKGVGGLDRPTKRWLEVDIPLECHECNRRVELPLQYRDIGDVIRYWCDQCEASTKHVPVGDDLDWRGIKLGFGEYREDDDPEIDGVQRDDQMPASTTS